MNELIIIEKFLEELEIEGVCGFFVDPEQDIDYRYWVYIVFDSEWVNELAPKPSQIIKRTKLDLKEEIKRWLGLDVHVGSLVKKCDL